MKRWKHICWLLLLITAAAACKKFLEVKPLDTLSGKDFWRTRDDAEKAINGAYGLLLDKFLDGTLYNEGDFRPGNWNWFNKRNLAAIGKNDLLNGGALCWDCGDGSGRTVDWSQFYRAIAAANLCADRIPKIEHPDFGSQQKKALAAEARFLRAFIYFYMVRLYGDVPLQLDPYDRQIKPREKMENVLLTLLADLDACKDDLPLAYDDPTFRAVRATKGGALTLMAHMNMWLAGFDKANQRKYWQDAASLGKAVIALGVYQLLPYTKETFKNIFKGRSEEGIFELSLDANYGVQFHSLICQWTLHEPIIHSSGNLYGGYGSEITPIKKHLDRIYPQGEQDKRFELWFDDPYCTLNPQSAMFLKFSAVTNPSTRDYDANFIFFRYADLLLLTAEAMANLGTQNNEAIALLNKVRERAGARLYAGSGGKPLQDAIFTEREKEMMGEGHLWYDLVRTGRITDRNQCENYFTPEQLARRAWTWPIYSGAVKNNPLITQNEYWIQ
ncbi:RagB/SusD family nutrient uptake outer membrane protein [Chitinophaga solisilvae]|uniref:RagB/SusD family nutrient uptake outer membrane protein n=1 Tax=Chitinophaga solisilvae TaxID=1233460 RepID=A0A3S1D290_9BACT|nr:RagB/SusD family nutrient uptake outer membrane protein [Chitinophaga solisilvae]NSL87881.1 RagB/SusD family nutrient uptake outer membrane protein [Chitinophaga solisilvae]